MSRILFAWELGGGYGHLAPFLPVARALVERGHDVTLAVRDIERARIVYGALPLRILQAPLCTKTYSGLAEPPLNYAEILMRYGYLDAPLLAGMVRAWRDVIGLTRADVLIADHAPTALLAARGRQLGRAVIGSAFAVPPPANPTPNMRAWVNVPAQRLANSDASVLAAIGASLLPGMPAVGALHEIFDGVEHLLSGVAELDPYGPRDPGGYLGLSAGLSGGAQPVWPEGDGPRVFAYLNSEYRHLDAALFALSAGPVRSLVYLLGATPALRQKYQGPRLAFSESLLDIIPTLAEADLCVCHGNVGTVMNSLRGGKPLLLLPLDLEKFLLSSAVERLGIARVVPPDVQPLDIGGALTRALAQRASLEAAARDFAVRHREPAVDTIVQRAAARIEALATRGPQA